jgi:tetratricopeptide (TPR) repeat protein
MIPSIVKKVRKFLQSTGFVTIVFVGLVPFAAHSQPKQGTQPAPHGEQSTPSDPPTEVLKELAELYSGGKDDAVVKKADAFLSKYPLTKDNLQLLFFQAASHYRLGQIDKAIRSFQRAVPVIEKLNNVLQRRYAFVFFRMAMLHRQQRRYDVAIKCVEAGLVREPQNSYYQILLGELYGERGDRRRALKHFHELLGSSVLAGEEKTVVQIKVDRLNPGGVGSSVPRVEMARERFYPGFSFAIVPLNYSPSETAVRDICVLLESKWLVRCEVLPSLSLEEDKILDRERRQYAGERILDELKRRYPVAARRQRNVVSLVGQDIFGPGTSYVFSWQSRQEGVGVVSARRFLSGLEDFYEPQIVLIRRLGIQFISATSSMLGFTRAIRADCPTAYPNEFREFQQKGSKLCESTVGQRDELLKAKGGTPGVVGAERNEMINRVHRTYYFE